ncbi:MAG: tetratricopeptide repeat protein [Saprospiraceae bacterium]
MVGLRSIQIGPYLAIFLVIFSICHAAAFEQDTSGIQALIDSCDAYVYKDNKRAVSAITKLIEKSEREDYQEGIIRGHVFRGGVWWSEMEWDSALVSYLKAMNIAEKYDFGDLFVLSSGNAGLVFQNKNIPDSALAYFGKAYLKAKEIGNQKRQVRQLVYRANLYKNLRNFPEAAVEYAKALQISEELKNPNLLASVYSGLGLVYTLVGEYQKALANLKLAASIYKEKEEFMLYSVYSNISSIYSANLVDKDSALYYATRAREVVPESRSSLLDNAMNINLGALYQALGQHDSAHHFFRKAFTNPFNQELTKERVILLSNYGFYYLKKGVLDSAAYFLKEGLAGADSLGLFDLQVEILRNSIKLELSRDRCEQLGSLYEDLFEAQRDLKVYETKQIIAQKEIEAELLKSAHNFEMLSLENESQRRELNNKSVRLRLISIFSALIAALSIVLGIQNRKKHLALVKLTLKNKEIADLAIQYPVFHSGIKEMSGDEKESHEWLLLARRLDRLIKEEKIHLNTQITAEDLSEKMGVSRRYCSEFLSKYTNMNFNEFINRQRVFEAQKILHDEKYANHTMEAIGEMCGFHSVRTFYNSFKSITGLTPAFYKDQKVS